MDVRLTKALNVSNWLYQDLLTAMVNAGKSRCIHPEFYQDPLLQKLIARNWTGDTTRPSLSLPTCATFAVLH